ncbi:hypothetical protein [Micromonospora sp. NPDC051141]|uniref:hypothetical protein n=1 Tax=Micromonospora sp. NPDC051141 TaxID=3364284 RepID=UPI0037B68F7D
MVEPAGAVRRHGAVLGALVLLAGAPACSADHPVAPLPVRPPVASTVAPTPPGVAAAPPTVTAPVPTPPRTDAPDARRSARTPARTPAARPTPPTGTTATTACFGAVRHDLDLAETELALVRSLCFAAGGVLRIQGIGPGQVTVDREDLVSRSYEAGVVDIRFVRAGTVVVTIPQHDRTYPITVVVV